MTDALALAPKSFPELHEMAKTLSSSALLPAALKQSPANVALIIQTGLELGMMPMQAIRMIHIIEGKPTLSADGMAGLCLRARDVCEYITLVASSGAKATYKAKRRGSEQVELSFTIEQAKVAGLTGKGNWAKFPEAMLRARALSGICRAVFADLVGGLYDFDELEREEKDVTPVAVVESRPTPPAAADIKSLKAAVKARRSMPVVDATATVTPAGSEWVPDAYAGKTIAQLNEKQLAWCITNSTAEVEKGGADREMWADRLLSFTDEYARRQVAAPRATPSVAAAESAVTP